jgi:hypothetical protein
MVLDISLKTFNPPRQDVFSQRDLEIIAKSLQVSLPEGCELVHFGQLPPANLRLRWQELDVTGTMVGQVKSWSGSIWV